MRAAKVQASLRIGADSPEPSLLAHTSIESRGTFRQKARSLASLNVWACAVKICHDGMLEDTNSLDGAQIRCSLVHPLLMILLLQLLLVRLCPRAVRLAFTSSCRLYWSLVTRKPVFGVCDQVRLKPAYSATQTS